ncbi:MAG TPA: DUF1549 domain-containing protein, partial [Tepidisphaeraceae bacterium]|nr:DUF1549 domain-containing protein [Tepidisphaeraceae bacterium]
LLAVYFQQHQINPPKIIPDPIFVRRAYLDTIGLLPTTQQLNEFLSDTSSQKRATLVQKLLSDKRAYADHWLTFWNDMLRNDYRGTGYIDGGRRQISGWLYSALVENIPYDRFVGELVNPTKASEGFARGILWRGTVNAAMLPPMQASQNIAQVFMGVNLKCASCHDSFINDWTLADAYGLAAIYSDEHLQLVQCDKPTGKTATLRFLYPQLGALNDKSDKPDRLKQFEQLVTSKANGRLPRTIVNRLWAKLIGRGLVEPIDDMDKPAWDSDLLDYLAEDLVAHDYNLKRTIELILTSDAYQLPTVEYLPSKEAYVFKGPLTRRLTAEQFCDAIATLGDQWPRLPASIEIDFSAGNLLGDMKQPQWIWTLEPEEVGRTREQQNTEKRETEAAKKKAEAEKKKADDLRKLADPANESEEPKTSPPPVGPAVPDKKPDDTKKPDEPKNALKPWDRHKVVFLKSIELEKVPSEAYAAVAASQGFSLLVNGKQAGRILSDGNRFGRVAVFDVKPQLIAGRNIFAIDVSSHSEKIGLTEEEVDKFLNSRNHINTVSGVGFYLRATTANSPPIELVSDESWRVRRAPEDGWPKRTIEPKDWFPAVKLPAELTPIDEGPALPPIRRIDFSNEAIDLGPTLKPAAATAAQPGHLRASLQGADPLMLALDRPNREQVITTRLTSATTIQALELTNGVALDNRLKQVSQHLLPLATKDPSAFIDDIYQHSLSRKPTETEKQVALEMFGEKPKPENIADFLWAISMLPEFQLIN